jgi:hypothetical protein
MEGLELPYLTELRVPDLVGVYKKQTQDIATR